MVWKDLSGTASIEKGCEGVLQSLRLEKSDTN